MLSPYRFRRGWGQHSLAFLYNNVGILDSIIHMGLILSLQHHIPNRTGFASQLHFQLDSLRTPAKPYNSNPHIISQQTFVSFLDIHLSSYPLQQTSPIFTNLIMLFRPSFQPFTISIHLSSTTMFRIFFISTALNRYHYFGLFDKSQHNKVPPSMSSANLQTLTNELCILFSFGHLQTWLHSETVTM